MADGWGISDEQIDAWIDEWAAVDRAAADYLAERCPWVREPLDDDDPLWLQDVVETISPTQEPEEHETEGVAAVMALQHADWLGLALGIVQRGAGGPLDAERVQADFEGLDDVEGDVEDPEGHLEVLDMALLHLLPRWQEIGVVDDGERLTARGAWAIPRALYLTWTEDG